MEQIHTGSEEIMQAVQIDLNSIDLFEFHMDNGLQGEQRVERTPTGYKTTLSGYGTAQQVNFAINRGVDMESQPYIDIDLDGIDELALKRAQHDVEEALQNAVLDEDKISERAVTKIRIYTTDMQLILEALRKGGL